MRTVGATKGLTWPFLILSFASTLVFMAGLAALQSICYSSGLPGLSGTSSPTAVFGMSAGYVDCKRIYRFYWFTFAFVLVTLIGLAVAAAMSAGIAFSRPFWTGMVTISIILMMIASEAFLGFTDWYEASLPGGVWVNRLRTVAAGAIMSVVFLIFLLMGLGVDWERRAGAGGVVEKPVTGVATPTTAV